MSRLAGPFQLDLSVISAIDFDKVFCVLRRMPMAWAKTVANGWTTSSRLHSVDRCPCLFCRADDCDNVLHYLRSPEFSAWIRERMPSPLSDDLGVGLAISPCDFLTLKYMFVKYTVYHSVRHKYNKYQPVSPQQWRTVCQNFIVTAAAKFESLVSGRVLSG